MILTFEVVDVLLWCFSLECVREFVFSVTFFEVACLSSFSEDISSKVKVPHQNDKRGYYGSGDHRICICLLRWRDISRYSRQRQVWEWGGATELAGV